jgi:hypothetical protein
LPRQNNTTGFFGFFFSVFLVGGGGGRPQRAKVTCKENLELTPCS